MIDKKAVTLTNIQKQLSKFWTLEHIGIEKETGDKTLSYEENAAVDLMNKISYYDEEQKRWFTSLLWKKDKTLLGSNYKKSLTILKSVEKGAKIKQTETLVNEAFNELMENNYAEKVPKTQRFDSKTPSHYIPCHAVYKLDRDSTKVRMVMNCSSKTETGNSLNDLLYTGPLLLPDYVKLLIQFRLHKVALTCDLSKMFLQIYLYKEEDMNLLRYLWRNCNDFNDPEEFRMKVLVFGKISSPFQAIWCVLEHAKRNGNSFPLAKVLILYSLYMDDIISSCEDEETARESAKQLDQLFALASMHTHKWASNKKEVLSQFEPDRLAPKENVKILGQVWNTKNDQITYTFSEIPEAELEERDTKRTFLKKSASLFDPLGLLAPFILLIKLLFQNLWLCKLDWDDYLNDDTQKQWIKFKQQIVNLNSIQISRQLMLPKPRKACYVAVFCDSSIKAYAASAYLVTHYNDNTFTSKLIIAKTRVTPIKILQNPETEISIVRLELLSMLIGARLVKYVQEAILPKLELKSVYCFSDSMINLCRLKRGFQYYKPFVAARLKEIADATSTKNWMHVPTDQNPADLGSRGINKVADLLSSTLWFEGPGFLCSIKPEKWHEISPIKTSSINMEEKEKQTIKILITLIKPDTFKTLLGRFSSWTKTINFFCYLLRFSYKPHFEFRKMPITIHEIELTEYFIFKIIQKLHFADDYNSLKETAKISSKSELSSLTPFLDKHGVMRSRTRLENSETLPYDTKFPIILPAKDSTIETFILHQHKKHFHAKLNYMLALIRTKYYLLKGRREITRILRKCLTRNCVKPIPLEQIMSPLPSTRIDNPICFQHISCDLYGPLYVKEYQQEKEVMKKVWGCIFTCLMSRGVHLELMHDMGTEEFLNSFRLMCARRGTPSTIYSDRGKYFLSADKELKTLYNSINWKKVQGETLDRKIQWVFNAPLSPWQTGTVERLVQSVKKPLKITVGTAKLTARQLEVLMTEVESIINNRPITTVSPESLNPVTPAELIGGRRMECLPTQTKASTTMTFNELWKKRKMVLFSFWNSWRNQYLLSQSIRKKWTSPNEQDLLGKIVLINDKNLTKNEWKLARIINCFQSKNDGQIRSVELQTATGILVRPLQKISLLENV